MPKKMHAFRQAPGTPEEVSKTDGSHTGYYLKKMLKKGKK